MAIVDYYYSVLSHGFPTIASWYAQVPGFKMGDADAVSQN